MKLRPGPAFETVQDLVDLHNHGPQIAEVRLRGAFAQVLIKSLLQHIPMVHDGLFELFELLYAPIHVQGDTGAEELPLLLYDGVYDLLCVDHFSSSLSFFLRSRNRRSMWCWALR